MNGRAIAYLSKDIKLKGIIDEVTLPDEDNDGNIYYALLRAIIYQQLSWKAAGTIHSRFLGLYGDTYPNPDQLLVATQEELRAVGLSRQKYGYVQNVAQYWNDNQLLDMAWITKSDDEVINELTEIKGVGTWTVQMLLMFTLDREDVFPLGDVGIQNAIVKIYNLRSKGKKLKIRMEQISKVWSPHRTLACKYLWKWIDG